MKRLYALAASVALAHPLALGPGGAANPATLSVGLVVPATCTVSGATLSFGSSNGDPVTTQTSVNVTCNSGQAWLLSADAGGNFDGANRRLSAGGGTPVPYLLYIDESMLIEMGDADLAGSYQTGVPISGIGTGAVQSVPIFGLLPAFGGGLAAGTYTDEVLLTVHF